MSKNAPLALLVLPAVLLLIISGCGNGGGSAATPPAEGDSSQGTASESGKFGTSVIRGKVTYEGPPPTTVQLKMTADPVCAAMHADGITKTKYVVGTGKGLKWVFVYVKDAKGSYAKPSEEVVLDQKGCQYDPHVFGIMTGQTLKILNSDATEHNINSRAKQTGPGAFNQSMPRKGMKLNKSFRKPEVMVRIKCDIHPWMECFAGVLSHPFHSVSGADGSFSIDRLPAGTYTIEAWHEGGGGGTQTQTVTVGDGETQEITFSFKAS